MCGVVMDGSDYKVVVAGGRNKNGYTDEVEIYDMMRDTWNFGEILYLLRVWDIFLA